MNAINLIDGLDGLALEYRALQLPQFSLCVIFMGIPAIILLYAALLGSIFGFLFFNFHPANIFMGDSGSLFLGFSLAVLSMLGFKQIAVMSFITPLLIIGVPLSDICFTLIAASHNANGVTLSLLASC